MKFKSSKTNKVNIKQSSTNKVEPEIVEPEVVAKALGIDVECDNCHKFDGKHAAHCYKRSKNISNVICGPVCLNWDSSILNNKILLLNNNKEIAEFKLLYNNLFGYLHAIIVSSNIDLPEPNVELIEDEINISWFSQKANIALSFSFIKENDKTVLWMSYLCDNKATDIYNPSYEQIVEKLKAFQIWKRILEIRSIISETDPRKFPNTISDTKLSNEEKLEFISEILSDLQMDFTDAEHQIEYHRDTLANNFRTVMNALNKIHCVTCLSVEEIDNMENGKN